MLGKTGYERTWLEGQALKVNFSPTNWRRFAFWARRSDYPEIYQSSFGDAPDTILSRGGSCIVDPFGKFLAGPNFEGEAILFGELDRNQLPRARFDLDVVGHYSRPDIFRLFVDDQPKPVVTKDE